MSQDGWLNSWLVFWVNLAVGAAILGAVLYFYGSGALGIIVADLHPATMAAFLVILLATIGSLALRWRIVLRALCPAPPLATLLAHRSAAHGLAVLLPSGKLGGDPLRAWLATRADVRASSAIASTAVDRSIETAASSPFSVLFALVLLQHGIPQLEEAALSIGVGSIALIIGIVVAVRRLRDGRGLVSALVRSTGADRWGLIDARMGAIESAEAEIALLSHKGGLMFGAFAMALFSNLLVIAEFVALLGAFGLPVDVAAVAGAIFATGAAHLFPVPAGVGVLEGAQMWMFEMLGHDPDVGLAVGLAVRLRELCWMAPGLIFLVVTQPWRAKREAPMA